MSGARRRVGPPGKGEKHWHVFRDNKYMHVRESEGERERGLFSACGCHGNRGLY